MTTRMFFERLDRNGDGRVNRNEFRQSMRDLASDFNLTAESLGKKDVDMMFAELDVRRAPLLGQRGCTALQILPPLCDSAVS